MEVMIVSLLTVVSTALGGLFTLHYRDKLHRILGFTAGVILGVVAFDLLPEIFELVKQQRVSARLPMITLVVGFLLFHIIEKSILLHSAHEGEYHGHKHPQVGVLSAAVLVGHSFLDGVGIGLAFQVSNSVGIAVALAVIAHDFADGMNTVGLLLRHGNSTERSKMFLAFDALAPVLGAASTLAFTISGTYLLAYLGLFCGVLLYIGVADILPEAHAQHSSRATMALTVAGVAFVFAVTSTL
jgi:zinc transporter ZupT